MLPDSVKELAGIWCKAISTDHHKTRDCYFYIETKWAYGEDPKFVAVHNGYVARDLVGKERDSFEEAEADLRKFMTEIITNHYNWATTMSHDPDEMEWSGDIIQHVLDTLKPYFEYEQLELPFGE